MFWVVNAPIRTLFITKIREVDAVLMNINVFGARGYIY